MGRMLDIVSKGQGHWDLIKARAGTIFQLTVGWYMIQALHSKKAFKVDFLWAQYKELIT